MRAALLGCRDLLRAALDGPGTPSERAGGLEGTAQVALAAVEAALAVHREPAAGPPARPRHLDVLDRPVELPVDLRASIRLV